MGRAIARQFLKPLPGLRLAGVMGRTIEQAAWLYTDAGASEVTACDTVARFEQAVAEGRPAVCDDPAVLFSAGGVDVVIECTGEVEFGAQIATGTLRHGKHLVLMNAELGATIGPILKVLADQAGVVFTDTDGDEPGVALNLVRFLRTMGCQPVCAGNLKGMIDPYRTPETQALFAAGAGQKATKVTGYADGTKLSMEATILANATGFRVARRGMLGPRCAHVREASTVFSAQLFREGGLVDYVLGAEPHTGAFVLAYDDDAVTRAYMSYFKMGDGPLYCFYTPFHLPHLQIAATVGRAALFHDATVTPAGPPTCDVITMAKRDLRAGEVLDGIGGYCCYGTIENIAVSLGGRHLPMGLSGGCRLRRDVPRDHALTYDEVELPAAGTAQTLRRTQDAVFFPEVAARADQPGGADTQVAGS